MSGHALQYYRLQLALAVIFPADILQTDARTRVTRLASSDMRSMIEAANAVAILHILHAKRFATVDLSKPSLSVSQPLSAQPSPIGSLSYAELKTLSCSTSVQMKTTVEEGTGRAEHVLAWYWDHRGTGSRWNFAS